MTISQAPTIVRDAERSEFSTLAELQIRSWRDVYRGIMPDAYLDEDIEHDLQARWSALEPSDDDLILIAAQSQAPGRRILGFITVWCQPDPYIDNLHVDPGERSQGIGCLLMRATASRLIGNSYDRMSLYVAAKNHRAAAFYRRLGGQFGDIEQVDQRYGESVDAIEVVWDDLAALAATD